MKFIFIVIISVWFISCKDTERIEVYKLKDESVYRLTNPSMEENRYLFYKNLNDSLVYRDFYLIEDDNGSIYYSNAHRKNKIKVFDFFDNGGSFLLPYDLITSHSFENSDEYYGYHNDFSESFQTKLNDIRIVKQTPGEIIYKLSFAVLDSIVYPSSHPTIVNSCNIYWSSKNKFVGIDHAQYNTGGIKKPPRLMYLIKENYEYLVLNEANTP